MKSIMLAMVLLFVNTISLEAPAVKISSIIQVEENCADYCEVPKSAPNLDDFLYDVAQRESSGDHKVVNRWGYMGLYQFHKRTLKGIGFEMDKETFLNNPTLQNAAMVAYMLQNKKVLKSEIEKYSGKTIEGIKITESGILAAAHLAGPYNVKKWFRWNSKKRKKMKDKLGTSAADYMKKFAGYKLNI